MTEGSEAIRAEWDREAELIRSKIDLVSDPIRDRLIGGQSFNIAGLDISFFKDSATLAVASVAVISFPALQTVHVTCQLVELEAPYIPGYLAFREARPLVALLERVIRGQEIPRGNPDGSTTPAGPPIPVDMILVDGNGIFHPAFVGLACHIGVAAGIPTIGAAKTFLDADGLTRRDCEAPIKAALLEHISPSPTDPLRTLATTATSDTTSTTPNPLPAFCVIAAHPLGANTTDTPPATHPHAPMVPPHVPLVGASGRTLGAALVPRGAGPPAGVRAPLPTVPVYVSVGHACSLDVALTVVNAAAQYRVVAPIRAADAASRDFVRRRDALVAAAER